MSEHDRVEYWTAISGPTKAERVSDMVNSPRWNSLSEKDKRFFLRVQKIVSSPSYTTPPPFYGLKTSQDKVVATS